MPYRVIELVVCYGKPERPHRVDDISLDCSKLRQQANHSMQLDTTMNTFIVSSAICTKFGVFDTQTRLQQTLNTIKSIKDVCNDAHIVVMECSGEVPPDAIISELDNNCDTLISLSQWEEVHELYDSTDNWDIVKNATEMLCFHKVLEIIKENNISPSGRIFKISGRYTITDEFDLSLYDQSCILDKIVIKKSSPSQFDDAVTGGIKDQYMSRLWSFPSSELDNISEVFENMLWYMSECLVTGGYVDIEHCLYKFLDHNKVVELEKIGVSGLLGPNGNLVND